MNWTPDKPTKEGWYWHKDDLGFLTIEHVKTNEETGHLCAEDQFGEHTWPVGEMNGQWAGPLEPPIDNPFANIKPQIIKP